MRNLIAFYAILPRKGCRVETVDNNENSPKTKSSPPIQDYRVIRFSTPECVGWALFMNELPEKAMKLLALALNHAAPEGEWHNAAVKAVLEMRKAGVPAEYFSKIQTHPQRAESPHIMPFGRFKGKPLSCLPDWYLGWIMDNLDLREPLLSRVQAELNNRDS